MPLKRKAVSQGCFSTQAGDAFKQASCWRYRHFENPMAAAPSVPYPSDLAIQVDGMQKAQNAVKKWPQYAESPLTRMPRAFEEKCKIGQLLIKDESDRMGVGSFKVLGGGYAAADAIERAGGNAVIICCSAGNHGVGVAWACQKFGGPKSEFHVFFNQNVGELLADRIRSMGGIVHRVQGSYEDALVAAQKMAAETEGSTMVQDGSWDGYESIPKQIWSGYTMLSQEIIAKLEAEGAPPPTHVFLNSGIGGLTGAVTSHFWAHYGAQRPRVISVEPLAADCLLNAAKNNKGEMVLLPESSETTIQVGLDCKIGDKILWKTLRIGVNDFVAVGDEVVQPCIDLLASELSPPLVAGDSAVAGLGVLVAAAEQPELYAALGLSPESRVVIIACEGAAK